MGNEERDIHGLCAYRHGVETAKSNVVLLYRWYFFVNNNY